MTTLNELEALAKAATPGPWEWVNPSDDSPFEGSGYASLRTIKLYGEDKTEVRNGLHYTSFALPKFVVEAEEITSVDDAVYIAAANPDTILQMIALIRQMGDALEFAADWAKPEDLNGCECPICKAIDAWKEFDK